MCNAPLLFVKYPKHPAGPEQITQRFHVRKQDTSAGDCDLQRLTYMITFHAISLNMTKPYLFIHGAVRPDKEKGRNLVLFFVHYIDTRMSFVLFFTVDELSFPDYDIRLHGHQ